MRTLIIAEHQNGQLNSATARTVACALQLGTDSIDVAVFSDQPSEIAEQCAVLNGINQVLTIERPENQQPVAAVLAPQIKELASDYSHILAPSTTFGKDLLPRVAALLDCPQVSDLMTVKGPYHFERPMYAGNAIAEIECLAERKLLATVRIASFQAVETIEQPAPVHPKTLNCNCPNHTRFKSLESDMGDRPDLQSASHVVAGGRGLGSAENFHLIEALADRLGAAVGASRAAVDAGYVANDLQVGQTGKIIAPDLYIAVGISGAIQHLTGIKDAGTIVAINRDQDAPIFEIADIGLVGDLFEVLPELNDELDQ